MSRFSDFLRQAKNTSCSVVVVAAGASTRMGEDKLFMDLSGMPVLARTLTALNSCGCVDEIVVVTRLESLEKTAALCREYRITKAGKVIVGGATRTESALAGLVQIRRNAKYVLIHDGARPLVTEDIVYDAMHSAALYKCAAPAVPVTDTVKETDCDTVVRTLNRSLIPHASASAPTISRTLPIFGSRRSTGASRRRRFAISWAGWSGSRSAASPSSHPLQRRRRYESQ